MKARPEHCHNLRLKSRHFSLKESSVILLVSHRAQSLQPYCDNWFENIKDLVDKYFKYDVLRGFCVVFICCQWRTLGRGREYWGGGQENFGVWDRQYWGVGQTMAENIGVQGREWQRILGYGAENGR